MTTIDIDAIQKVVDDFNAENLTGTWVRYWTGTRQDPAKYGQTRTEAQLLSGHTPVVWVTGHGACIALTHVDVIPGQPDGIEDDSHDLPELAGAAERVGEYIAATGDGIYDVIDGHPLYARDLEALRRAADYVWVADQYKAAAEQYKAALAETQKQLAGTTAALTASRTQAANRGDEVGRLVAGNARLRQQLGEATDVLLANGCKQVADEMDAAAGTDTRTYLIWSNHHHRWFASNGCGYRSNPADAGRYTVPDAQKWLGRGCDCCRVPEVLVRADVVIGAGERTVRAAIAEATKAAIEAGQVNRNFEPVAEVAS